ncbi:MAG TPA: tetratricopeptide repeat protein, partial [Candidatus Obscuribacterales bacterium]
AGDYGTAIAAWQTAIDLYQRLADPAAANTLSESLAQAYIATERYPEAASLIQQQITTAETARDFTRQVQALNNLGTVQIQQGRVPQAQLTFATALDVATAARNFGGMGLSLSNLGLTARLLGDLPSAQRYYEAATNYRLQAGDKVGLAHSSNSLGAVYQQLGAEGPALGAYLVARRTALELSHVPTLLPALDGLIAIYSDRGDTAKVREYIGERVVFTAEDAPPEQRLGLYVGLGRYYTQLGDLPRARAAYGEALPLAEAVGDTAQRAEILNQLQALPATAAD